MSDAGGQSSGDDAAIQCPPRAEQSQLAWSGDTYSAWVNRFGAPAQAVQKLRKNPTTVLEPIRKHFGKVAGKRFVNIMGSNGIKAIALAMLGADVTVIDFSPGNAKYAKELAKEAQLEIHYIVADILQLPSSEIESSYGIAFAELGIVHYFDDLLPVMTTAKRLLSIGGKFILRDFHPISTKLISSRGTTAKIRKHKVTGDYFDTTHEQKAASFTKHLPEGARDSGSTVLWRKWTLGEIITAVASTGLRIVLLEEEPNPSGYDRQFPKTFTLVAENT